MMGIDIEQIPEDTLLQTLGQGDWHIALPGQRYSDLVISAAWRQSLIKVAATLFVRWVLNGISITINHHYDPPWDHSGHAERHHVDPLVLLARHETLLGWMENEYTGNSTATYTSGYGLAWDTYGDAVQEELSDRLFALLESHFDLFIVEDDDEKEDLLAAAIDDSALIQSILEHALCQWLSHMKTGELWEQYQQEIRGEIDEERRQIAERTRQRDMMLEQARLFWLQHFTDLVHRRIEMPQFKALHFAERLGELLADADPDIVRAIAEVGLPGSFSNSVHTAIQTIARRSLEDGSEWHDWQLN